MKTLITTTLFLTSLSSLTQQVCEWNGLADANWNNPENWTLAIVPSTGDSVVIHDGPFDTFLNSDISFSFLSIDSAATLSLGAINLTLTGDVENNGVLNSGLSRVIFNGTVQQTICGDITFNKLEINNSIALIKNVELNFILKIGVLFKMTNNLNNSANVSFLMETQIELFVRQRVVRNHSMEIIF